MPLQSHPSCQGYRQGIEREINAGNKINEVGRAQDYGMDGRADSGMARPGFQWAAVSWQLEEGGRSGGVGGGNGWTCCMLWLLHNNGVRWHCAHLKDVSAVINYIRQPLDDIEMRITFRILLSRWDRKAVWNERTAVFWCDTFSAHFFSANATHFVCASVVELKMSTVVVGLAWSIITDIYAV